MERRIVQEENNCKLVKTTIITLIPAKQSNSIVGICCRARICKLLGAQESIPWLLNVYNSGSVFQNYNAQKKIQKNWSGQERLTKSG
jgi:hypothetical protein